MLLWIFKLSLNKRLWLGLLAPGYCAFLLVGCVVLSTDWPPPKPSVEAIVIDPTMGIAITTTPPPNFKEFKVIKERKKAFLSYFRPLIEGQNKRLIEQQKWLAAIAAKQLDGEPLSDNDRVALALWSEHYGVKAEAPEQQLLKLKRRMRPLPTALVLAQAATESAWGSSRFAREGYNYFGQWCFVEGCGLVPKKRIEGAKHEVAKFDSPLDSVTAYFHNINSHRAYRALRQLREDTLGSGAPLTAAALLPGLKHYSQRGEAYLDDLRKMIRQNKLEIPRPVTETSTSTIDVSSLSEPTQILKQNHPSPNE